TDYVQAPGQFANNETYRIEGNKHKLLGPPSGGGSYSADNSSVVSLGMAGGSVTVRFDPPIADHPDNIGGYDFIVFGNAYWPNGSPERVWQEPGTVWVMKDENGNGDPDDTWYLIPGSHLDAESVPEPVEYSLDDAGLPPPADKKAEWWPEGAESPLAFPDVYLLDDEVYPVSGASETCYGYADSTPTLLLGDFSGADGGGNDNSLDDPEDYPEIDPVYFYTVPDSHETPGIDAGSGGGNAVKLEWAVDPADFSPAELDEISWIRVVSGSLSTGSLGDYSCEVDGFARVRRSAP
ncbi:MAG: hypothetical protein ACOCYA_06250, partial [Spirochaetota bacterium]